MSSDTDTPDLSAPDLDGPDFFTDGALLRDPYAWLHALRDECPLRRETHHDVVMVTGYDEVVSIYNDTEHFSSCTSVSGPFPGFPVPLDGHDDITDLIAQHRDELPFHDQLPTLDPPVHTDHRALLARMITPKRLRENEEFIRRIVDEQLDEALSTDGQCELIAAFAAPVALLVVADLLGVPEEDHDAFREAMLTKAGTVGSTKGESMQQTPLEYLYVRFSDYISDRRAKPQEDVLTGVAMATFPDGRTPEVMDAVRVAANLFAAGGETTVRLLSTAAMLLAEDQDLQTRIRADRDLVPNFIEECLRFESPVRGDFRLSKVPVTVEGVDLDAGTTVMLVNAAANRDPAKFPDPDVFDPTRDNARSHVTFGRGVHTCPGAPLARAEAVIGINRLLDRTERISIDEAHHGPAEARQYRYVPTFILRGLTKLHIRYTPAAP